MHNTPLAIAEFNTPKAKALFTKMKVFSEEETSCIGSVWEVAPCRVSTAEVVHDRLEV